MEELKNRKRLRLEHYDYDESGAYFVTICTLNRRCILSDITVGDGALDVPKTKLTNAGKIVEKNLLSSQKIPGVTVEQYVIMPNHIHAIISLYTAEPSNENGTSKAPSPTNKMLPHIISTFKRFSNKELGENIFQRGYFEHIIRGKQDYAEVVRYICENPERWHYDELYKEE